MQEIGLIPGWEDTLEEGMATHSSILAWRIPWTEETGGLQSNGVTKIWTQLRDWACIQTLLKDVTQGWYGDGCIHSNNYHILGAFSKREPLDFPNLLNMGMKTNKKRSHRWLFILLAWEIRVINLNGNASNGPVMEGSWGVRCRHVMSEVSIQWWCRVLELHACICSTREKSRLETET